MDLQNQNKNYYALVTANQKGTRDKGSKKKQRNRHKNNHVPVMIEQLTTTQQNKTIEKIWYIPAVAPNWCLHWYLSLG